MSNSQNNKKVFHGFNNGNQVFFYEHEYYCLSNFSSFAVEEEGIIYMTSEHLYHCKKFNDKNIITQIINSLSAHDALKIATENKSARRSDWDDVKLKVM